MKQQARMRDVAKLAGVATMTVSRVLSGRVKVSDDTRRLVLDAVAKLNYRPNEIARSLREQKTRQIGIIIPNLHDQFFSICAYAISVVAKQHSYSAIIAMIAQNPQLEYEEAIRLIQRQVDGLIVVPAKGISRLISNEFNRIPIIAIDRPLEGSSFDSVTVDNRNGAALGVRHLIEHGHKRIAFLGFSDQIYTIRERLAGYRSAITNAGLIPIERLTGESREETLDTVRALLAEKYPPTAIFCCNNLITRNTLYALSILDVQIPEDIAVAGFDDFEMADAYRPAITVVRQSPEEMGRLAGELLISRLTSDKAPEQKRDIVIPSELVVRASCGFHKASSNKATKSPRKPLALQT